MKRIHWVFFIILLSVLFSCEKKTESKLKSFNVSDVTILDGSFYRAQQTGMNYILALDPDRLLAPFLKDAGFEPLKENYGNWESTGLDGHIGGHYLSALSFMYAATGNEELEKRIDYMIGWLAKCQEKNGNGYVGGIPNGRELWDEIAKGEIEAGSFSLNNRWVPLYNIHKLYAGLLDVYKITGNETALNILLQLSGWFLNMTANLSDEQIQEMLRSEHGGLNEIFVEVAELTGEKKYLHLAERLSDKVILNPLLQQKNELTGLHANTQIPKVIGYKQYADATNNKTWADAAEFFWNTVIEEWTISIGGNSVREHFHPADDFSSMIKSRQGPETCNTYNMLRLTKLLYLSDPKAKYLDYYERALFNHILSSEHTTKGGFVYFTPMRPRHYRVYSQPQLCFWCCVGSGIENPGRYGEMIYAHNEKDVFVNLFIASELHWDEKGLILTQHTGFPYSEHSEFNIQLDEAQEFSLNIRNPDWVKEGELKIAVNGIEKKIDITSKPYITINKEWQSGDSVTISFPMKTSIEYLPDKSSWISFLHGPIVLAAISDSSNLDGLWADDSRMGHIAHGKLYPIDESPMLVTDEENILPYIQPVDKKELTFSISHLIYQEEYKHLVLKPFFDIHEARYIVYWPILTSEELEAKMNEIKTKEHEQLALEARTIDQVAPGEQQPEAEHNFKGERTSTGINDNRFWRDARGWFSYELSDPEKEAKTLRITYFGLDKDRVFDMYINNEKLATVKLEGDKGDTFYDIDYEIPRNFIEKSNDEMINLKFVAAENSKAGGIYHIRLLK